MKGVILAGGKGTRLKPYTLTVPKPMVTIMNKPILEYNIALLKANGITSIMITTCYKADKISEYFGDGSEFGVDITYFHEDFPLGTAGGVFESSHYLNEPFVVISGDAFTTLSLRDAIEFHQLKGSPLTIVGKEMEDPRGYGVCKTDSEGRLIEFAEKPESGEINSKLVNTGIYVIQPELLRKYPFEGNIDFSRDVFPRMIREQDNIYVFETEDYWRDIGNPEQYKLAREDYLNGKMKEKAGADSIEEVGSIKDGFESTLKYLIRMMVACPDHQKQQIISKLVEEQKEAPVLNLDGILISHSVGGWTRIIDKPSNGFIIYSKAERRNLAKEFAGYYFNKIKQWQRV
ncbi:nucleotidyltransferase family protein [Bacillus sp. SG-1]|uniref:nucleotidyltransferase family protein n=1 Tax=Bacillus sp. SG-1 TaxID=161544 RepID=UPI0001544874|nr:nucleotidyltransferase family protein [Bacillus sp. SG-1]EDL64429.1 Mannose-1-phosphate guanyltransferase (pyrophosphorylase domain and phosphomannomutase domain) [Bacillus sp. SG-1]